MDPEEEYVDPAALDETDQSDNEPTGAPVDDDPDTDPETGGDPQDAYAQALVTGRGNPPAVLDASDFGPPRVLDASDFDPPRVLDASDFGPPAEGGLKSAGRALAHEAIPFAASLAPMAAGAGFGARLGLAAAPFMGPLAPAAPFVGGLIGGAIGGGVAAYGASKAQEAVLDATGLNDAEQRKANEEAHPNWATAGRLAPNAIAFSPGKLADSLAQRLLMGGGMMAIEAGQELATEGTVHPGSLLEAGAIGAIFKDPRKIAQPLMSAGERVGEAAARYLPTSARVAAGDQTAKTDQQTTAQSEPPKVGIGVAQEQPPPRKDNPGVGNNSGERSEREYGKPTAAEEYRQRRMRETPPMEEPKDESGTTIMEPGKVAPDHAAALSDTPLNAPVNSPRQTEMPAPQARVPENPVRENANGATPPQNIAVENREQAGPQPAQTQNLTPPVPPPASGTVPGAPAHTQNAPRFPQARATPPNVGETNMAGRSSAIAPRAEPGVGEPGPGGLIPRFGGERPPERQQTVRVNPPGVRVPWMVPRSLDPVEAARAAREAPERLAERMAAEQKGEAFQDRPENLPSPVTERAAAPVAKGVSANAETTRPGEKPATAALTSRREVSAETPPRQAEPAAPVNAPRAPRILEDLTTTRPEEPIVKSKAPEPAVAGKQEAAVPRGSSEGAYEVKTHDGRVVAYAQSEALARKRSNALRIAKETMDKFEGEFAREYDPRNPKSVAELRKAAQAAVEHAQAEGWTKYMPRERKGNEAAHLETPREALWMDEVAKFAKKTSGKAADFITREKLLRADEEGANLVRQQRQEEGEARFRRGPTAEEAESMGLIKGEADALPRGKPPEGGAVLNGEHIETLGTKKLRERMSEITGNRSSIAREVAAQEPNVMVHEISHETMDRIGKEQFGVPVEGFYNWEAHSIFVRPGASPEVLLHEGVHAITSRRIASNPEMARYIASVMRALKSRIDPKYENAMSNPREFLAWGMSNPGFQAHLGEIKLTPGMANAMGLPRQAMSIKNGFQAFVSAVRRILDLPEGHHTALEAVVKLTDLARSQPDLTAFKTRPGNDAMVQAVNNVRQQADDVLKQAKGPALLRVRDNFNIARQADSIFGGAEKNPIRKVVDAIEMARMKTLKIKQRDVEDVLRDGLTLQKAHPQEWPVLQSLLEKETMYQRYGDRPLNQQGFDTRGPYKAYRDSKHAEVEQLWNSLPQALQNHRADLYTFAEKRLDALGEKAAGNTLIKRLGFEDERLVKRILADTWTEADFQRLGSDNLQRYNNLQLIMDIGDQTSQKGPYSPLRRYGQYVVTGKFNTPGMDQAKRISDNTFEFKTKAEAEDAARQQHSQAGIQSYYVDVDPQSPHFGERYHQVTGIVTDKQGQPVLDRNGAPRTYPKDIAFMKQDPNVERRWGVTVQRDYMSQHDTYAQAKEHHKGLTDLGNFEKLDLQTKKFQPQGDAIKLASDFGTDIEQRLKHSLAYEQMSDRDKFAVKQLLAEQYLEAISATKINNARLKRNFVPGASDDVLRNFLEYSEDTASRLGMMEHLPAIEKGMTDAEAMINAPGEQKFSNARRAVHNEISSRVHDIQNGFFSIASGQMGPATHRLMSVSAMARLATPGFTIRNLTQSLAFLSEVAGKHGYPAAGRALMEAYRDIGSGKILKQGLSDTLKGIKGKLTDPATMVGDMRARLTDPREREMIDHLTERGRMDQDAGFQMAEFMPHAQDTKVDFKFGRTHGVEKENMVTRGAEKALGGLDTAIHYMEQISRQMPRAAETVNRGSTALVAYRLEKKALMKQGMSEPQAHDKAMRYADDTVGSTHFVYSETNKPTWQRNPWVRPATQFKQFGKSVYEMLGKHVSNAIDRDLPPAERKAARRALGGLFVAHTVVAGAMGLPWEPVRAMLLGAKTLGMINKDWDDVESGVREAAVKFGKLAGLDSKTAKIASEALMKGLPRLLGMDMSPGLGIDNMLLFGSPRSGTDRDYDNNLMAWAFQMFTGAPMALAIQGFHGVRDLISGDYASAIEKLAPMKIISDVTKAEEGYRLGKQDARGRQKQRPYTPYEAGLKAAGIPTRVDAEQGAYAHQVFQEGQEARTAKSKATAAWIAAKSPEEKDKAFQRAREAGVTAKDLTQAATRERSTQKRIVNGVVTTKGTRPAAERLREVYDTE